MDYLKEKHGIKVLDRVEEDPTLEDNLHVDQNNIEYFFNVRYCLKIFKLFLMIMNVSYFTGILWIIFCEITEDLWYTRTEHGIQDHDSGETETFVDAYSLNSVSKYHKTIISLYYSFTSLSTVGFGDFHPKSNLERIFCSIMLVAGVMIFSYIMGNFIAMIEGYKEMKSDIEHDDSLSKFFGLLKRFNNGKEINHSLQSEIQDYFTLRW